MCVHDLEPPSANIAAIVLVPWRYGSVEDMQDIQYVLPTLPFRLTGLALAASFKFESK